MLKKIVIIGPESTGKSTLCTQLASHFKTTWCPEYAREYLSNMEQIISYDNLLTRGQLELKVGQLVLSKKHNLQKTPLETKRNNYF